MLGHRLPRIGWIPMVLSLLFMLAVVACGAAATATPAPAKASQPAAAQPAGVLGA